MTQILFPNPRILVEFGHLEGVLHSIFMNFIEQFWPDPDRYVRVTCIYRTKEEEIAAGGKSGIHTVGPFYRAIDLGAREFTQEAVSAAAAKINVLWEYDPSRPEKVVCYAEPHGSGPHFHLQVHPNTIKRKVSV